MCQPLCKREFTGSKMVVATHFDPRVSTQQLRKCIAQKPADLVSDLETLLAERTTNNANKKRHAENQYLNRGSSILSGMFAKKNCKFGEQGVDRTQGSSGGTSAVHHCTIRFFK